jgi:hypothetical protein
MSTDFNSLYAAEQEAQLKVAEEKKRAEEELEASRIFMKAASSQDVGELKFATDHSNDLVRIRLREHSIFKTLFTWTKTDNKDLVEQFDTLENIRYFDYEVDSPMSMSVGLYANPVNYTFAPRKGMMKFHRHITPRMTIDMNELRTVKWDIRRNMADNTVRDVSLNYDASGFSVWQRAVGRLPGTKQPWAGAPQWVQLHSGFNRSIPVFIKSQMIKVQTDTGFGVEHVLMNNRTALAQALPGREQMGGDLAQDMFVNGVVKDMFGSLKAHYTIKRKMVGDGTIWAFTNEKHFMRCSYLEELTMTLKNEYGQIEFSAMDNAGMLLVNPKNVIRVDLLNLSV